MDIVQPDLCAAGGISECRKIAALASRTGRMRPARLGLGDRAGGDGAVPRALPDTPPCLRPQPPMLEFEQTPNPLRDHLAKDPIVQNKGIVRVPDGPGLGIEVDRAVLAQYKVA
jgi:D-galactarolactone cycloisomerase